MTLCIGVLASGEGTTLQALLDALKASGSPARVGVVISNNSQSGALRRAQESDIPAVHLSSHTHPDPVALDVAIRDALLIAGSDIVLLAGYMKKLGPVTLHAFNGCVLNTHPALLPKYGGRGMFGQRVHETVLAAKDRETGVSVHLVDGEYDNGRVIAQCRVAVLPDDSVEELTKRVQTSELIVATILRIARERQAG